MSASFRTWLCSMLCRLYVLMLPPSLLDENLLSFAINKESFSESLLASRFFAQSVHLVLRLPFVMFSTPSDLQSSLTGWKPCNATRPTRKNDLGSLLAG